MAGHVLTLRLAESQFQRLQGLSEKTRRLNAPKANLIAQEQVERDFGVR